MHKLFLAAASLVVSLAGAFAPEAHAMSAVQCKPAITGYGQHIEKLKARRLARIDFLAKAQAKYGKIVLDIVIAAGCNFQGANEGWKCTHRSQPCVDGGLKPSISKTPSAKPPRIRVKPKLRRAPKLMLRGSVMKPQTSRGLRLR